MHLTVTCGHYMVVALPLLHTVESAWAPAGLFHLVYATQNSRVLARVSGFCLGPGRVRNLGALSHAFISLESMQAGPIRLPGPRSLSVGVDCRACMDS